MSSHGKQTDIVIFKALIMNCLEFKYSLTDVISALSIT